MFFDLSSSVPRLCIGLQNANPGGVLPACLRAHKAAKRKPKMDSTGNSLDWVFFSRYSHRPLSEVHLGYVAYVLIFFL